MSELYTLTDLLNDANCQAYYRFNNGTLVTDSKNSNTLTNNNSVGQTLSGKYGYGADFGSPNTNKDLRSTNNFNVTTYNGSFSVAFWLRQASEISTGYWAPFSFVQQSDSTHRVLNYIYYEHNGGNLRIKISRYAAGGAGQGGNDEYYAITLGTDWRHIAFVYNGSNIKLYIDGTLRKTLTTTDIYGTTYSPVLTLGSDGAVFFPGQLDDVVHFNRELTSDEVALLASTASPSLSPSVSESRSPSLSISPSPSASTSGSSSESPSPSSSISYSQAIGSGMHSKGSYETLPATNDHLEIEYGDDDDQAILADDGIRASIVGAGETLAHQFTFQNNTNRNGIKIKLNLRSTLATYTSPAILQIWNNQTNVWDTLMINNSTGANVDFDMINIIDSDYEKYYDESYKVIIRVYQALG